MLSVSSDGVLEKAWLEPNADGPDRLASKQSVPSCVHRYVESYACIYLLAAVRPHRHYIAFIHGADGDLNSRWRFKLA